MSLQIGQKAPDFTLYKTFNETVSLSDFAGKNNVLLLFFPLAFSGNCIKQLCSARDNMAVYNKIDAQVIGISVDTVASQNKFSEEQGFNFPLLSDFNKEVSTAYQCIHESFTHMNMKGVSKRSAFIIDKQGVIQYAEVSDNPGVQPNFEAINEIIVRLG
ncbi:MAG: redoxin domain-containing protein [Bacteroidota bacterium]